MIQPKKIITIIVAISFLILTIAGFAFSDSIVYPKKPSINDKNLTISYQGNIWLFNLETKKYNPLTFDKNYNTMPRFSPDGTKISYNSNENGDNNIFYIDLKTNITKKLTFHSAFDMNIGWTNDSENVLFRTYRGGFPGFGQLYTVNVKGGQPEWIGSNMGYTGSYEPNGNRIAINRQSTHWIRKGYRGPFNTEVWIFNPEDKRYKNITNFNGFDRWPMWAKDGFIYFVNDSDGIFNIWRCDENGENKEQITFHKSDGVQFPYLDVEHNQIVYENDFKIWLLNLETKKTETINLDFWNTKITNKIYTQTYINQLDEYDISPTGKRLLMNVRGELFIVPLSEGENIKITDSPARDQKPIWSPDGKWIAFISDRTGEEQIYIINSKGKRLQQITDRKSLKTGIWWSPDSKHLLISEFDGKLYNYNIETGNELTLIDVDSYYVEWADWSPDGKWIAYSTDTREYHSDIYMIRSQGGIPINITDTAGEDGDVSFTKKGDALIFISTRENGRQIYLQPLLPEKQDEADEEKKLREQERLILASPEEKKKIMAMKMQKAMLEKKMGLKYDFKRLKSRLKKITNLGGNTFDPVINTTGNRIFFVSLSLVAGNVFYGIYSIDIEGKNPVLLMQSPVMISDLKLSSDNRNLIFKHGNMPMILDTYTRIRKPIPIRVNVKIDDEKEKEQIFREAHRIIKYHFYDPSYHGFNWEEITNKYKPMVKYCVNREELTLLIAEMLGELNASHMGSWHRKGIAYSTPEFAFDLKKDTENNRYQISYIYKESPADKDYIDLNIDNYLLAINGIDVTLDKNLAEILNSLPNKQWLTLTINNNSTYKGSWKVRIKSVQQWEKAKLQYKRWVEENRAKVDELSGGKVGYLHIKSMDHKCLFQFYLDMEKYRDKKAMIIDIRFNGGGNIDQELIDFLERKQYQEIKARNMEKPRTRPYRGYFGKKAVLINQFCGSDAEVFPQGFKDLKLGKLIGMPTYGAVIGIWIHKFLGGSYMTIPGMGIKTVDGNLLENNPVQPDIRVDNPPEDFHNKKDTQLETAINHLLEEIDKTNS